MIGIFLAALVAAAARAADPWDIADDFWGGGMAEEHWTVDERFPGTKLNVNGRYSLRRRPGEQRTPDCACGPASSFERMFLTFGGDLRWGKGDSQLEYGTAFFTPFAAKRLLEAEQPGLTAAHETLELGIIRFSKDDPLGIESYLELTAARVARIWAIEPSSSPWSFTVGANLSGGFAWAESTEEAYRDVSNLIVGTWAKGTATHRRLGTLYLEQRIVNGWTFSSPARGGPVSRAATARFGYTNRWFKSCVEIELYAEKRSFNFADPDAPNLYTKAKRVGLELSCRF